MLLRQEYVYVSEGDGTQTRMKRYATLSPSSHDGMYTRVEKEIQNILSNVLHYHIEVISQTIVATDTFKYQEVQVGSNF